MTKEFTRQEHHGAKKPRVIFGAWLGSSNKELVTLICCLPYDVGAMEAGRAGTKISVRESDSDYVAAELVKAGWVEKPSV